MLVLAADNQGSRTEHGSGPRGKSHENGPVGLGALRMTSETIIEILID